MSLAAPGSDALAEPHTVARAGGQPDAATSSARTYACTRQRKGRANWSKYKEKYYKRGKIRLMTCLARDQRLETYFYEVDVRNGNTAKCDV
jgi:hypothetical protein